ncbi:response regulator [Catenovulum adriaticum]|uniref:Response regulator n=1 Tax=Catenovulum adriaticum TaxID=2984846 RepID=A0ABY7ANB9_9ALTE|nr:response regulator [Catenovulum sp. TS8]WAJ71058.1 response regulator [Catenovulum sp. TS8]
MKILVVDDNASVRAELVNQLADEHQVHYAENGLAALSMTQSQSFDFIVTDYKMPLMDGIKLVENLFAELAYQPSQILVLTTDSSQAIKFKLKQLDIKWFEKPVSAEKVNCHISQCCDTEAA